MDLLDRCRDALSCFAAGDASGPTLEFRQAGTFEPIGDLVGMGHFDLIRVNGRMTFRWHWAKNIAARLDLWQA